MKKLLLSVAALACLFTACKKDDDNNNSSASSFKIGGTTYTTTSVADSSGMLYATAANGIMLVDFSGTALPTTGGSYSIVEWADSAMQLSVSTITSGGFYDTKDANVSAAVTVTNGKVKVVIPEVWAYNAFNDDDSVKISATLTQQ